MTPNSLADALGRIAAGPARVSLVLDPAPAPATALFVLSSALTQSEAWAEVLLLDGADAALRAELSARVAAAGLVLRDCAGPTGLTDAITRAEGAFIAIASADCVWVEGKLARQLELLADAGCPAVWTHVEARSRNPLETRANQIAGKARAVNLPGADSAGWLARWVRANELPHDGTLVARSAALRAGLAALRAAGVGVARPCGLALALHAGRPAMLELPAAIWLVGDERAVPVGGPADVTEQNLRRLDGLDLATTLPPALHAAAFATEIDGKGWACDALLPLRIESLLTEPIFDLHIWSALRRLAAHPDAGVRAATLAWQAELARRLDPFGYKRACGNARDDDERQELAVRLYGDFTKVHELHGIEGQLFAERIGSTWSHAPRFRVFVPAESHELKALSDTLESLYHQMYGNWVLEVVSTDGAPGEVFNTDGRLAWTRREAGESWRAVVNRRLGQIGADWVLCLPPGSTLATQALVQIADHINLRGDARVVYADHDQATGDGDERRPHFKPDFTLELLRGHDYIGAACAADARALADAGGLEDVDGLAWYGALLRVVDSFSEYVVRHVAAPLFHFQAEPPADHGPELIAIVQAHLDRQAPGCATAGAGRMQNTVRTTWKHAHPRVSILVPTRDKIEFLEPCIQSVFELTDYADFEVVVIDNQSSEAETFEFYDRMRAEWGSRFCVVGYPHPFNYAAQMNLGVRAATGDVIVLLNNDCQIVQAQWLERMVQHAMRPDVGVVGARLVFPESGLLQHAGIVLGMRDGAGDPIVSPAQHLHIGESPDQPGWMNTLVTDHEASAVTGACLMTRREVWEQLGGMDDQAFAVLYNDVDYCLRVRRLGLKVLMTPFATLVHHGSVSIRAEFGLDAERAVADAQKSVTRSQERDRFLTRWLPQIANDRFYNPNLSLSNSRALPETALPINWDRAFHDRPRVFGLPAPGGAGDYRMIDPFRGLSEAGLMQTDYVRFAGAKLRLPSVPELARLEPDVFVLHTAVSDGLIAAWKRYKRFLPNILRVQGLDDLITAIPEKSSIHDDMKRQYRDMRRRLRESLALSDRLVVSTAPLADFCAGMIDDIRIVPNGLTRARWDGLRSRRNRGAKPRFGWVGAAQHRGDLELVFEVVKALAGEVDWVFMGMCPDEIRPYVKEFVGWTRIEDYPKRMAALDLDLAIAPLEVNAFNECKSNLRLLEYGACGWPVVCTDIHPYREANAPVVRLPNEPAKWISTLRELAHSPDVRAKLGDGLRDWVRNGFWLDHHLDDWASAFSPRGVQDLRIGEYEGVDDEMPQADSEPASDEAPAASVANASFPA